MLNVDKQKHLLSRAGYKYELVDVAEPNLLREQFPYTDPPRIYFHGREYPMDPPEDFWVTDTTFRDGQQARRFIDRDHGAILVKDLEAFHSISRVVSCSRQIISTFAFDSICESFQPACIRISLGGCEICHPCQGHNR